MVTYSLIMLINLPYALFVRIDGGLPDDRRGHVRQDVQRGDVPAHHRGHRGFRGVSPVDRHRGSDRNRASSPSDALLLHAHLGRHLHHPVQRGLRLFGRQRGAGVGLRRAGLERRRQPDEGRRRTFVGLLRIQ